MEAALDRLGAALEGSLRALAAKDDRAGVAAALEAENVALRQTRMEVSGRLDAAIERLHRVLAH